MNCYKKYLVIVIANIFFISCHSNSKKEIDEKSENLSTTTYKDSLINKMNSYFPIYINKNKKYDNKGFIFLQDVGSVEYIKLETTDNCLLKGKRLLEGILLDNDNIFISTSDNVFRFDKNGKFINSIGKIGEGPNEFILLLDFKINKDLKEVLILDATSRKICIYDYDGNFKSSYSLKAYCSGFDIVDAGILLCSNNINNNRPTIFTTSTINGDILTEISPIRTKRTGAKTVLMEYYTDNKYYNNQLIYNTFMMDTIYSVNKKTLIMSPRYIQLPVNNGIGESNSIPYLLFETDRYANILIYSDIPSNYTYIVDKKENKIYKGYFGDYEKGTAIIPINTNIDNVIVDMYDSFELQDRLSKNKLSGKLKEISQSLNDEDNPILMIATINFK